jgi:hypothetical protein
VGDGLAFAVGSGLGTDGSVGLGAAVAAGGVDTVGAVVGEPWIDELALATTRDEGAEAPEGTGGTSVAQPARASPKMTAAVIRIERRDAIGGRRSGVIAANDTRTHHTSNGRLAQRVSAAYPVAAVARRTFLIDRSTATSRRGPARCPSLVRWRVSSP